MLVLGRIKQLLKLLSSGVAELSISSGFHVSESFRIIRRLLKPNPNFYKLEKMPRLLQIGKDAIGRDTTDIKPPVTQP